MLPDYAQFDATGLAELVAAKEVSRVELWQSATSAIAALDAELNAVVHQFDPPIERTNSEGPFAGVPFLLKDLHGALFGTPLSMGSRLYQDYRCGADSELVNRLLEAGLVMIGRSNSPEFGLMAATEPVLHGPTKNPWDLRLTAGGSSGGAAAAVASGMVPMAHASDGGGSIRIPAACCGVFGLKPTRARPPQGPEASERWLGRMVEHVISRSVRDSAVALDATEGPELTSLYHAPPLARPYASEMHQTLRPLRIAFTTEPLLPGTPHADCRRAVEEVASLCESLGHHVEEARPVMDAQSFARDYVTVSGASVAAELALAERKIGRSASFEDLEPATWLLRFLGEATTGAQAIAAHVELQARAREVLRFYEPYAVLLTHTLGSPPVPHGRFRSQGFEKRMHRMVAKRKLRRVLRIPAVVESVASKVFEFIPFTPVANITGQPAMNVPLVWNEAGLPIGTMFTGRFGDEATLFQLAFQLEEARSWMHRRPPAPLR